VPQRREPPEQSLGRQPGLAQIRLVSELDSFPERGGRAPAEFCQAADVEQFARRAVGPRRIEADLVGVADDGGDQAGEFGVRDVLAGADIDSSRW
jgi:hypothetical protein